ncbi:MAG: glycerophosphodiester phosphodiesterase [Actinomycetota bacterium]|nr:glycerophosphodiester phosphodiesterase [Actinomycetota bacterium]
MAEPLPPTPARLPIGFAHRGARAQCPENTLPAFETALALGASGLETDAWLTADGEVVLDHDGVVGPRVRRRPIASLRRGELPFHIPTLADLYERCGTSFELSVDVKDRAGTNALISTARDVGATDRLWLCDPEVAQLASWRALDPAVHLVLSTRLRNLARETETWVRHLRDLGVEAINLREREWTPGLVTDMHDGGLLAFGWDAQEARTLRRLVAAGIDGVYSDYVERMMSAVNDASQPDRK